MKAQTRINMNFISRLLEGFDGQIDDLVKLTCYYKTDGSERSLYDSMTIWSECFTIQAPASTNVPLENLGFEGVELEIEGVALLR